MGSQTFFFVGSVQTRLYNVTDSASLLIGEQMYSGGSGTAGARTLLTGRFTLSGTKTVAFQYQSTLTRASDGLGLATSFGTEVYNDLMIWKIA